MQVFKAFYKVIYKNKFQIFIYIGVFLALSIALSNFGSGSAAGFSETKFTIAIINDDAGAAVADGLTGYLKEKATVVDIEDDEQKLQDALFYRDVNFILRIPKGFSDALLAGDNMLLSKTSVPGSTTGMYMDLLINKYLNTVKIYAKNTENLTMDQILGHVRDDLKLESRVEMGSFEKKATVAESAAYYFNFLAYSLFAVLILGMGAVLLAFNKTDVKRRNLCSPMRSFNMNIQMFLGCISFALVSWILLMIVGFFMYRDNMFSINGLLLTASTFIFTLAALSISFLLANVIKSQNAISAASNVFTLGTCFISGVMVPQEFLGSQVLTIASFTPTYWFVKTNNLITGLVEFSSKDLATIGLNLLIMLGFAVAVLAVTLVVIKQRRVSA
jgi:ABC-2 type transport system permease protein